MTDPRLTPERIADLLDYATDKLELLLVGVQHGAQDQSRQHAETILALIEERETLLAQGLILSPDASARFEALLANPPPPSERLRELLRSRKHNEDDTFAKLTAENERLRAVAETCDAIRECSKHYTVLRDRCEECQAFYAAITANGVAVHAWKAART